MKLADMLAEALGKAQTDLPEQIQSTDELKDHLTCAEGCETAQDFLANVDEALLVIRAMQRDLIGHRDEIRSHLGLKPA